MAKFVGVIDRGMDAVVYLNPLAVASVMVDENGDALVSLTSGDVVCVDHDDVDVDTLLDTFEEGMGEEPNLVEGGA
jgi:hypothetical protein